MELSFHYSCVEGQQKLLNALTSMVMDYNEVVIMCVGTDRVSGDSLGPLVGTLLHENCGYANIYGTLQNPVHAQNLEETVKTIRRKHPDAFVVAIDACLGRQANVEKIVLLNKPLKPGTGVNKNLPEVGNITIQGIVNVGGFMPHLVIQNTRMHTIYNMSKVIAGTLAQAVIAHKNFYPIYRLKEA